MHLKNWAVQERKKNVESGEVEINEMIQQVRLWKGVMRLVEGEGSTFPLLLTGEQGNGHNGSK